MVIEIGWRLLVLGIVNGFWLGVCLLARENRYKNR